MKAIPSHPIISRQILILLFLLNLPEASLGTQASLISSRIARCGGAEKAIARPLPDLQPIMRSEDVLEAVQSFMERRKASFRGF